MLSGIPGIKRGAAGLLALLLASAPTQSIAITVNGTFKPQLTIVAVCSITTVLMNFGTVTNLNAARNGNGRVRVNCSSGTPYAVGLGTGLYGASVTTRQMKRTLSAVNLPYGIWSNAARSQNWGQTIGVDTVAGTGTGAVQSYTAYGRVPAFVGPQIGVYTDVVQVVVTY